MASEPSDPLYLKAELAAAREGQRVAMAYAEVHKKAAIAYKEAWEKEKANVKYAEEQWYTADRSRKLWENECHNAAKTRREMASATMIMFFGILVLMTLYLIK